MSVKLSYILNTAFIGASQLLDNIISYGIILLLTRTLSVNVMGDYFFMFSLIGLFFIFSDLGLAPLLTKDLSRNFTNYKKYFSASFYTKSITSVLLGCIAICYVYFTTPAISFPFIFVTLGFIVNSMFSPFYTYLIIKKRGVLISSLAIIEKCSYILGILLAISIGISLQTVAIFYFVSLVIRNCLIVLYYFLTEKKWFFASISVPFIFSLLKKSYPFIFITLASALYIRLDTIMLYYLVGDLSVGQYNLAYKLISLLQIIPAIVLIFGFPLMSSLYKKHKKDLSRFFHLIIYYSVSFLFPVVIGTLFLGDRIFSFIYNLSSPEATQVLQILIFAEVFIFLSFYFSHLLSSTDNQKSVMYISFLGAGVNILLNFILISFFGLNGAAYATVFTYFIITVAMGYMAHKKVIPIEFSPKFLLVLLGSVVLLIGLPAILSLHVAVIILVAGIAYGSVVWIPSVLIDFRKDYKEITNLFIQKLKLK